MMLAKIIDTPEMEYKGILFSNIIILIYSYVADGVTNK